MHGLQPFLKPAAAMADTLSAGIIRSVREPERKVAAAKLARDLDAIDHVLQSTGTDRRVGISEGAEFVFLILEHVRVDGSRVQPLPGR